MKQPWHTRGYIKISHTLMYIGMQVNAGLLTPKAAAPIITLLCDAGRTIRREKETKR
jgi:hypothetical protein